MQFIDIIKSNKKAIIDDEDAELLSKYTWRLQSCNQKGKPIYYASATMQYERFKWYGPAMHRILLGPQQGFIIDHIDGDGLNNQRNNLRLCTPAQNARNKGKRHLSSASKDYKGIFFSKFNNAWGASVRYNNKSINLGSFQSEIEAAIAFDIAAAYSYGEYARLNFPECTEYPSELRDQILRRIHGTFEAFSSQYCGVSCLKVPRGGKKWHAGIKYQKKPINLGSYHIEQEAAYAYDIAVVYLGGAQINCNFPSLCLDEQFINAIHLLIDNRLTALDLIRGAHVKPIQFRHRRKNVITPNINIQNAI